MKRIAELKALLARLQALDRSKLSFDDGIDAAAIEGEIRSNLLDLETLRVWERNPMFYVAVSAFSINDLMKRDFAPKAERLRSVIGRLKAVPAICEAGKANVKIRRRSSRRSPSGCPRSGRILCAEVGFGRLTEAGSTARLAEAKQARERRRRR
jgi:hypothetical protein